MTALDSESWVCGRCGGQMIGHRPADGLCRECHVLAVTAPACPGPHEPPLKPSADCYAEHHAGFGSLRICAAEPPHEWHYDPFDNEHWRVVDGQRRITPCTRKDKP